MRRLIAELFTLVGARRNYDTSVVNRLRRELHDAYARLSHESELPIPQRHKDRVANLKATLKRLIVAMKADGEWMSPYDQMLLRTATAVMEDEIDGLG